MEKPISTALVMVSPKSNRFTRPGYDIQQANWKPWPSRKLVSFPMKHGGSFQFFFCNSLPGRVLNSSLLLNMAIEIVSCPITNCDFP